MPPVFCSDFLNIYSSNISSGASFLAGENIIAVQDGSSPNYKLLFFEIDDSGYPVFAGQTSLYTSLRGYFSYSEGKVITSRYPVKSLYIHNIDSYNVSSVQTVNIGLSTIQFPEPGLGTAGQIKLNNNSLIIIFNDNNYNYVFFTAKINESSITYSASGVTDVIIPINTYFTYPTATCGCAVGIDKAIVCAEINENYVNKMVFIAAKSDGVVTQKSSPLQCSDVDGVPIMASSHDNSFCLMYLVGNNIKFVYGEIDDDLNVLFSVPFSLGLSASNVSRSGSIIYEGAGNYTFLCNYYNNNSWNTLISSINIDNFVITRNDTERFFSGTGQTGIVTFMGSQSLDRNILLTYGTGNYPLSNSGKLYSLSTWKIEDVINIEEFWTNRILHKEMLSGMLIKQSTSAITPGTPGQSYVPATPAIPSKTTFFSYTKKECKKVG